MNFDAYFILYANCVPVKGHSRSIICDLQRGNYVFIPNSLYELSLKFRLCTLKEILIFYPELDQETLGEYVEYLLEYELGFFCENPNNFPLLEQHFDLPYLIYDCIIELSDILLNNVNTIAEKLNLLGCQQLEIRLFENYSLPKLSSFIDSISKTKIRNINVYIKYNNYDADGYDIFVKKLPIIGLFIVHTSPEEFISRSNGSLHFVRESLLDNSCCGIIDPALFVTNQMFFLESINKNSCLNKKLSISNNGDIKNCPSLPKVFGNIINDDPLSIILSSQYQYLWNVTKDQIDVCKECEFRYICSDCRAFLNSEFDKPLKCKYNPQTAQYEN